MTKIFCITTARAMRAIGEPYRRAEITFVPDWSPAAFDPTPEQVGDLLEDVVDAEFEPDEWECKAAWCPTNGSYQCDECMRSDPGSPYYQPEGDD